MSEYRTGGFSRRKARWKRIHLDTKSPGNGASTSAAKPAGTGYGSSITFLLAGIYHTLQSGESLQVPACTSGNQLSIREQSATGAWVWDNAYTPAYGKNYKIVRVGSTNNLTLAVE